MKEEAGASKGDAPIPAPLDKPFCSPVCAPLTVPDRAASIDFRDAFARVLRSHAFEARAVFSAA